VPLCFITSSFSLLLKSEKLKEVDAIVIELSDSPIAFAEKKMILHYSANEKSVLIEI
jgi:hypothetical protein